MGRRSSEAISTTRPAETAGTLQRAATVATLQAHKTISTPQASETTTTTQLSETIGTLQPIAAYCGGKMGDPWYINADDELSDLNERIQRKEKTDKSGTVVKQAQAVDLSSITSTTVEYWNGSAWVALTGTGSVTMSADTDSEGNNFWDANFSRDVGATSGLTGSLPRRWLFSDGTNDMRVPEKGHDVIVINPDPS